MKNFLALVFSLCIVLCLTACKDEKNQSNALDETKGAQITCTVCKKSISETATYCEHCGVKVEPNINGDSSDDDYNKFREFIESEEFEKAYKTLDDFKNTAKADELRNKFIIIENVLISQDLSAIEDKFGNTVGPFTVKYNYDATGNLIEINAVDAARKTSGTSFNPFMNYVYKINYYPYFEKLLYSDNQMIKVEGYSQDLKKIIYTADFNYDQKGNVAKVIYTYNYGSTETTYTYNQNNQLIQVEHHDMHRGDKTIKKLEYDNSGNPTTHGTVYDANGKVTQSVYYYNTNGSIVMGRCTWNYGNFYIYND